MDSKFSEYFQSIAVQNINRQEKNQMLSLCSLTKDSFERFGDDLTQVLLSYLKVEERLRFESVSKQWKTLLFNKINKLLIGFNGQYINHLNRNDRPNEIYFWKTLTKSFDGLKTFELLLKKCPNIRSIDLQNGFKNRELVFELIIKYCNHLNEINSNFNGFSKNLIKNFFNKFGPNLKKIGFVTKSQVNDEVLKYCPNLKVIDIKAFDNISIVFKDNELLYKKLKKFSFTYSPKDMKRIEVFFESNKTNLESIEIEIGLSTHLSSKLSNCLSELKNLKSLSIRCLVFIDQSIVSLLRSMSGKCLKLEEIKIYCFLNSFDLTLELFKTINCFKFLRRLDLHLWNAWNQNFNYQQLKSELLKECKLLSHLIIKVDNRLITDDFFHNIDKYLPKLKLFQCLNSLATDKAFKSMAKLSELQLIGLITESSEEQSIDILIDWKNNFRKLTEFHYENKIYSIHLFDDAICELRQFGHSIA